MYNHHVNANDKWYDALNNTPGRIGAPIEKPRHNVRQYFLDWLDRDGHPFWPFWENIRGWWNTRDLPNVRMLHFASLKADMPLEIRRIAEFLEISIAPSHWDAIIQHCTFDYMKTNATKSVPLGGLFWDGGAETFINKGTNGRWRDVLTAKDIERYEQRARLELGEQCAQWLSTGTLPA